MIEYLFQATSRKLFGAEHQQLLLKLQTKRLGPQNKIIQSDQTMSQQNGTKAGAMDSYGDLKALHETNLWNLRRDGLDGKAIQMQYDAGVVLSNLNNNDKYNVCTRHFGSLNSTFKRV